MIIVKVFMFLHKVASSFQHAQRMYIAISILLLSGCVAHQAPTFTLLGSYFPSWMACAFIGLGVTIGIRLVLIRIGIDDVLPTRLLLYTCLALAVAFLSSLLIFAR
ncbi:YtcA family lipoprotein [Rahnella variigena]|uniref:YtcA family lipoprotein n=1 Tax=Rahnella variigena TaxID=574964 RepID=UPI002168DCCD|nr:YtcA family lipoprotein [Rahnella variigena]